MTETSFATQQVRDLTGQGGPSQPEPSVAWSGGDPGCEAHTGSLAGRVIEPRNRRDRGSRRRDGRGRHHRRRRDWPGAAGSAGVVERGMQAGVAQEPGRSRRLHRRRGPADGRHTSSVPAPGVPAPRERTGRTVVPPSEGRRSAAGRAARSRSSLMVPPKSGNPPHGDPAEGSGGPDQWTAGRTDGLATEPSSRLHASPAAGGEPSETAARGCAHA